MEVGKGKLAHDPQSTPESFFGFTGKPDHDIGSQSEVRNCRNATVYQTDELFGIVRAIHGGQDGVVSTLQRDMKIGAEL